MPARHGRGVGGRRRTGESLGLAACLAFLAAIFAAQAMAGRHLTADGVLFQHLALTATPLEILDHALVTAVRKAKIGELFSIPVMVLGTAWIDHWAGRAASIAAFALALTSLAGYLTRAYGDRAALLFALLTVSILPLRLGNVPPTAYPLFPFLQVAIFFAGMLLHGSSGGRGRRGMGSALIGLSLVSSEYTLVFCGTFLALHLLLGVDGDRPPGRMRLFRLAVDGRVIAAGLAALTHVGFRTLAPGDYTAVSGAEVPGEVLRTQALHIANGTIFGPASFSSVPRLPSPGDITLAGAAFVAAGWAALVTLRRSGCLGEGWRLALLGLSVSVAVTLPVALLEKYRRWCEGGWDCAFVDSRLAGIGMAIALAGLCLAAAGARAGPGRRRLAAGAIGAAAAATVMHNAAVSDAMRAHARPWRLAAEALCAGGGPGSAEWQLFMDSRAARSIPFHPAPWRERGSYWAAWAGEAECRR